MKKIIIIGASGFIGRNLVNSMEQLERQERIRIYKCDIDNQCDFNTSGKSVEELYEYIKGEDIDIIINLAAISSDARCKENKEKVKS